MARNEHREFSESDSLSAVDLGRAPDLDEIQERQPAWADRLREARQEPSEAPERDGTDDRDGDIEPPPLSAAPDAQTAASPDEEADIPEANDEYRETVTREQARKDEAEEAWQREAQRVESTMFARRRLPGDQLDLEEAQQQKGRRSKRSKAGGSKRKSKKKKKKKGDERQGFLRRMIIILVCSGLFLMVAMMVVSSFVDHPILSIPRRAVTAIVRPVQSFFSRIADGVTDYLRMLKVRGNIEYEYEQLRLQLDDYATLVAQDEELRHTISELYDLLDEQSSHMDMNPLPAQVIGTDSGTYFSTLTLDVGSDRGVTEYMAVVAQGGLVGVTYDVEAGSCKVRCVINSDCTVAGLVQSSRDQGSVKGTLGTNGEAMCRMYYLPDTSLPRPGDVVVTSGVGMKFPKGIPIGYIRESTRGMEDNKSYVVLEPVVDFQHLEYVTVYRYEPYYAEPAQSRTSTSSTLSLEPLETAQPVPTFQVGGVSDFIFASTPAPDGAQTAEETPSPTATPSPTPSPTATPDPDATPTPANLEYVAADPLGRTPTPSPRPTATPTPSPAPTPDPGQMMVEDDE